MVLRGWNLTAGSGRHRGLAHIGASGFRLVRSWSSGPRIDYAGTDNRANPQALKKGSVSWPLMGLMMQMADVLVDVGGKLKLQWRPREENQETDDLTNELFDVFDLAKRVNIRLEDLPLDLFLSLQEVYAYAEFAQGV